jgi:hypothetical protein
MKQLKLVLTNGFFILILYLIIVMSVLIVAEMQPVAADQVVQPVTAPVVQPVQESTPAGLPERDITQQRFAPLE